MVEQTYKTFVRHRALDQARDMVLSYPNIDLQPLPEMIDLHSSILTVIKVSEHCQH